MQTTGTRDGFAVHDISYYQKAFDIFSPTGACVLLGAFHEDQPLAYLMLFLSGERSWYFYGASDDASRNLMPTYRFKRGFGGEVVRSAPAFIRVYQPLLYRAYQKIRAGRMAD